MTGDLTARWASIVNLHTKEGLSQPEIAREAKVNQSTVSRILLKRPSREGPAFRRLCMYATQRQRMPSSSAPSENAILMGALRDVWDGSAEHAEALAAIIRAVQLATQLANR